MSRIGRLSQLQAFGLVVLALLLGAFNVYASIALRRVSIEFAGWSYLVLSIGMYYAVCFVGLGPIRGTPTGAVLRCSRVKWAVVCVLCSVMPIALGAALLRNSSPARGPVDGVRVMNVCVFSPVAEELLFRLIIIRSIILRATQLKWLGAGASSAVFVVLHALSYTDAPAELAVPATLAIAQLSLVASWIFMSFGWSLWWPIIYHAMFNAIGTFLIGDDALALWAVNGGALVGALCAWWVWKRVTVTSATRK
jgi:membrane protease YdiL (CAAX protease family)